MKIYQQQKKKYLYKHEQTTQNKFNNHINNNNQFNIKIYIMKTEQLKQELEWWRTYGEYVAKVHNNVDAEACAFADGDFE